MNRIRNKPESATALALGTALPPLRARFRRIAASSLRVERRPNYERAHHRHEARSRAARPTGVLSELAVMRMADAVRARRGLAESPEARADTVKPIQGGPLLGLPASNSVLRIPYVFGHHSTWSFCGVLR